MWTIHPTLLSVAALPAASALMGWALLLLAVAWSLRREPEKFTGYDRWGWWILLAGAMAAFRWPLITLPHEIYPDESQLLSGALTLRHDPVFWRSVDGGTAGPLDYYILLPAAFFPGATAYAVTRLIATLVIWGMLVAAGESLTLITSRAAARVAVLPAAAIAALTTSPEFIHYSTELVPGLLLALAGLMIVRQSVQDSRGNLWAAALLLGATPFAKLQAAPIAAFLGLLLMVLEITSGRSRQVGLLIVVALLPTLLVAVLVTATGQAEHMLIPYFLQNLHYAEIGRLPFPDVVRQLGAQSATNGYHVLWLAGCGVFCTGVVLLARNTPGRLWRHGLAMVMLLAVTLFCILSPGRPYHHYLNLLTLPVTLLAGLVLAVALQPRTSGTNPRPGFVLGAFLLCTLVPQLVLRVSPRPDPYEYYNTTVVVRGPAHDELIAALKRLSSPGEPLGLWGWRSSLYIEAGLPQATREAHTTFQLIAGPWQKYYLRRYYEDLVAATPPVFADTAGSGHFWFTNRASGHEVFPLLSDWLRTNYAYVGEWDGVRLYARLDRMPTARRGD